MLLSSLCFVERVCPTLSEESKGLVMQRDLSRASAQFLALQETGEESINLETQTPEFGRWN